MRQVHEEPTKPRRNGAAALPIINPFANIEHRMLLPSPEAIARLLRIESDNSGKLAVEAKA